MGNPEEPSVEVRSTDGCAVSPVPIAKIIARLREKGILHLVDGPDQGFVPATRPHLPESSLLPPEKKDK